MQRSPEITAHMRYPVAIWAESLLAASVADPLTNHCVAQLMVSNGAEYQNEPVIDSVHVLSGST